MISRDLWCKLNLVLEEVRYETPWDIWSVASGQVMPCWEAGRGEIELNPMKRIIGHSLKERLYPVVVIGRELSLR